MSNNVTSTIAYNPEEFDSDEPPHPELQSGEDEYLLSDRFDPGVWLTKAPGTKIGRSKRRWFVLHRRERQLVYYSMAFIPPAKAPAKGIIKLDEITGISRRNNFIEISVAKGRSMYKLEAESDDVASDWTYILKVETQLLAPSAQKSGRHKELMVQYAVVTPDDSYLNMEPDDSSAQPNEGSNTRSAPAHSTEDTAQAGSYLEMAPTDNAADANTDTNVNANANVDGSYLEMGPDDPSLPEAAYVPVDPTSSLEASYVPLEPSELSKSSKRVVVTADANGFGVVFGGAVNADEAAQYGAGIFVSNVRQGSAAAQIADITAGMQILSINGVNVVDATFDTLDAILKDSTDHLELDISLNTALYDTYQSIPKVSARTQKQFSVDIVDKARRRVSMKPEYMDIGLATLNAADALDEIQLPDRQTAPPGADDTGAESTQFYEHGDDVGIPNYVAIHDFEPDNIDEVAAKRGEVFRITEIWPDGWYFGQNLDTMKVGIIPGNYLFAAILPEDAEPVAPPVVLEVFPDRYMTLEPDPE